MSKNTKLFLSFLIALIIGIAFYLTPYLAFHNMKKAVENKDADALSDYVDYPSLRESLKANLNAKMIGEVAKNKEANLFGTLGAVFAALLINPMVDVLITPESLAVLMKDEKPQLDKSKNALKANSHPKESETEISRSYKSFNRFVVRIKKKGSDEEPVELIFKRDSLLSWKLYALRIP